MPGTRGREKVTLIYAGPVTDQSRGDLHDDTLVPSVDFFWILLVCVHHSQLLHPFVKLLPRSGQFRKISDYVAIAGVIVLHLTIILTYQQSHAHISTYLMESILATAFKL